MFIGSLYLFYQLGRTNFAARATCAPIGPIKSCRQICGCSHQPPARDMRSLMSVLQTYRFKGFLVPIGVERWQQVDSGLCHQVTYPLVAGPILQTHELHQQEEQLSSQHLVTMGTCRVAKLWFTWLDGFVRRKRTGGRKKGVVCAIFKWNNTNMRQRKTLSL